MSKKVAAPAMGKKVAAPAMGKKVAAPSPKAGPSNVVRDERKLRVVHTEDVGGIKVREVREERRVVEYIEKPKPKHSEPKALTGSKPVALKGEAIILARVKLVVPAAAHKPAAKR